MHLLEFPTFNIMIFFKKHFSVNYSVGELGFKLIFAEKLVKLNWLRFLHHIIVFWQVFSLFSWLENQLISACILGLKIS